MTRSGNVVFLPYDLRIPLARYVAKSKISQLRRYSVAPVFREKRIFGLHPTEIIECAFDIITSGPKSAASDAECLQDRSVCAFFAIKHTNAHADGQASM